MKHEGCFNCGSQTQEVLKSKTVGALDTKGRGKTISAALCDLCFSATDVLDMRTTKGKA